MMIITEAKIVTERKGWGNILDIEVVKQFMRTMSNPDYLYNCLDNVTINFQA